MLDRPAAALAAWRERAETLLAEVSALALAARDPRTPVAAKLLVLAVVAYAASPVDPVPDIVPVVGYLDELVVLPAGVALARRLVPDPVLADCRERADGTLPAGRWRWAVAAAVLLSWAAVGLAVLHVVWP